MEKSICFAGEEMLFLLLKEIVAASLGTTKAFLFHITLNMADSSSHKYRLYSIPGLYKGVVIDYLRRKDIPVT